MTDNRPHTEILTVPTKTNMAPQRGWAPLGMRLAAKVPHGHWNTTTFLAALRHDRIDAPWLIEGPIDGETFQTYVAKLLVPTLCPGDIVIMDNLGSHKGKAVRRLIRSAGAKLIFLPKIFARPEPHRTGLRQTQAPVAQNRSAHSGSHLAPQSVKASKAFTPDECANYFRNAGYGLT